MKSVRTEQQLLAEALAVQDASNLSGVVHSYSRALSDLWAIANESNEGTEWVNQHPVAVLFAEKVRHLTRADEDMRLHDAFQLAMDMEVRHG